MGGWWCVRCGDALAWVPDGKTRARLVPLSSAAAEVLSELPRKDRRPWVILGARSGRHLGDLQPAWERIRERAGLQDVRIHDLRHSCATFRYRLAA